MELTIDKETRGVLNLGSFLDYSIQGLINLFNGDGIATFQEDEKDIILEPYVTIKELQDAKIEKILIRTSSIGYRLPAKFRDQGYLFVLIDISIPPNLVCLIKEAIESLNKIFKNAHSRNSNPPLFNRPFQIIILDWKMKKDVFKLNLNLCYFLYDLKSHEIVTPSGLTNSNIIVLPGLYDWIEYQDLIRVLFYFLGIFIHGKNVGNNFHLIDNFYKKDNQAKIIYDFFL